MSLGPSLTAATVRIGRSSAHDLNCDGFTGNAYCAVDARECAITVKAAG